MQQIQRGDHVLARDALNKWVPRRALSSAVKGMDFTIVWVCREEDWPGASAGDKINAEAGAVPWPAEDVRLAAA